MGDGSIPPPKFNYNTKTNFSEDLIQEDLESSFQSYLNETDDDNEARLRKRIQEEVVEQEQTRKQILKEAAMEETVEAESVEESDLEEEKVSEKEAKSDQKFAKKKLKSKQPQSKQTSELRESKKKGAIEGERDSEEIEEEAEEKTQEQESVLRGNNRYISDKGEDKSALEEDPLLNAKKAIQQEKEEMSEQVHEAQDELDHMESIKKQTKEEKSQQTEPQRQHKPSSTSSSQVKKTPPSDTSISINIAHTGPLASNSQTPTQKTHAKSETSELYQDLEAIAEEILSGAEVLKNGDEIVTTVSLNMKGSIFDKGEVTVKAYRYRPLEVNLSFKKFSHQGTQAMQKNSDRLKKVLKEKSLKVHQLDIIEE